MNKEKFTWGLALFSIGGLILLNNLDVIDFYWRSVLRLWPLILIVIGINLLLPKRGIGSVISALVTICALLFVAYQGTIPPQQKFWDFWKPRLNIDHYDVDIRDGKKTWNKQRKFSNAFSQQYHDSIKVAYLNIKGGAVAYEIEGHSADLFNATSSSSVANHIFETTKFSRDGDSTIRLTFRMTKPKSGRDMNLQDVGDEVKIKLNNNPIWHINLDMGAGAANFDLRDYKIQHLAFKGGASAFEAKLGMPLEESRISINSGVASIEIEIPEAAACQIQIKSGLSSRSFKGFDKQPDGSYITSGFENATHKYIIDLEGGLSSFEVKRY